MMISCRVMPSDGTAAAVTQADLGLVSVLPSLRDVLAYGGVVLPLRQVQGMNASP
jgi:hypothetical protein